MRSALPIAKGDKTLVFYDMTRLFSKRFAPIATGIDRVDLRFGRAILEEYGENCLPLVRVGRKAILADGKLARSLVSSLEKTWFDGQPCDFRTGYALELAGLTQSTKGPLAYLFPAIHNLTTIQSIIFISSRLFRGTRGQSIPRVSWQQESPTDWIVTVFVSLPIAVLVATLDLLLKLPFIILRAVQSSLRKDAREIIPELLADGSSGVYVVCSPAGIATLPGWLAQLSSACGLRTVAYIHDILPIEYPNYYKPGKSTYLANILSELKDCRTTFVANSRETAVRLDTFFKSMKWQIGRIPVIYPGVEKNSNRAGALSGSHEYSLDDAEPYFVVVGTVEPRKNHSLLLQVWADLVQSGIKPVPQLHIVGSRGWDTDRVLGELDRNDAVRPHVTEHHDLSDEKLRTLIRGARALLFPTLAEGFGIPLVEALQLGTRVIASDLPVLREIAGDAPIYLSPFDGVGWKQAVVECTADGQFEYRPIPQSLVDEFSWNRGSKALIEVIRSIHNTEQMWSRAITNPEHLAYEVS